MEKVGPIFIIFMKFLTYPRKDLSTYQSKALGICFITSTHNPIMAETVYSGKKRLVFLEAMKALCVFSVFFFHLSRIFDAEDWHVKDPNHTLISNFYLYEIGMAIMPAFFFVSGAGIWCSLQKRSVGTMVKNIIKRFFLPLAFGCLVLGCVQVYLERLSHGQFHGSLFDFIPHYFTGWYAINGNFAWYGLHLWYLVLLFIYTVTLLPVFVLGKKVLQKPLSQRLTGSVLLLVLFALATVLPGWKLHVHSFWGNRMWGGWNLFENILFFVFGFVAFSNASVLLEKVRRIKWIALAVAVGLTTLSVYWYQTQQMPPFRSTFFSVKLLVRSLACWAWITAMVGITFQYFNTENKRLKYISEAVFPFYLLNQPIILVLAYYVTQWHVSLALKFAFIGITSFVSTIALYELVRRVAFFRWLFGIPQKAEVKKVNKLFSSVKLVGKGETAAVHVQEP